MDKKFGTFRKATFGGFNRKDVISYIEKIKNETFEYRCQVEDTVKKLNDKIAQLETALAGSEGTAVPVASKSELYGDGYTDIKDATEHLKEVADELCSSLGEFIEKLSQRGLCDADCVSVADTVTQAPAKEASSDVESILSSLSFLSSDKPEEAADKENNGNGTQVDEILSGLSFLF